MNTLHPNAVIESHLAGSYDSALVVLSIVFAILASSCALDVADRIRAAQKRFDQSIWLGAGAVTIGSGVWAMHFTGMLAFSLPIPVKYDFLTTLLSVAPAQFAGGVALYIMSHERLRTKQLLIGGILMGTGIGAMHHIGMMAMRMDAVMHHDMLLFAASVMAAILLAIAALHVEAKGRDKTSRLHFHGSRFISALVMGVAVASMHYTAMAAVSFSSIGAPDAEPIGMGTYEMAVWVGLVVLGVVALWKITTIFGRQHEATRLLEHEFREHERTGQELKTSEKSLKEQNQRFNAALDNMPAGLCMYDKNHVLVVSNDNFAKMYGVAPELLKPGTTMREVMEQRIANGVYAGESPEAYIENRLKWVHRRKAGSKTETLVDGRTIQITQQPMENGGWLTIHEDISDRKRAEAALQESEEQFRNLVEGSIQGVFIARNWKILFANQALADIFGYESPDEVLALGEVGPLIVPEERERIHGYKTMREKGECAPEIYESRGIMKDGSIIDIEFRVRQVEWRSTSAMQCVVVDITERKRTEEALRRQNERFDTALANMSQGLCMFDAQARLIVCNELYASMYGLTPELVKPGTSPSEIVKHRVANGIYAGANPEAYIQERDNWGRTVSSERKCLELSDGRRIAISRHSLTDGGWVATHEDITESSMAEKALMESEARFRAVFDNSPFCLNLKDTQGSYLFANKRYEEWWGHSAEEIIGKKAHEFQSDACRIETMAATEKVVMETGATYESETTVKCPLDGQMHDRLLIKFPVKSPEGSILGIGTFAVDITERKRAEEELIRHRDNLQELVDQATEDLKTKAEELRQSLVKEKELNELQRQFVSMASHEFRTPLAIIDTAAQRLKRRADTNRLTPEDAAQRVGKIRSAVKRMTRLMESTLTAARMQDGKIKVDIKPCDIKAAVREVCARQQEISQGHVIACDLAELPATIQADTDSMEQVLTNLLSNAVKYAPDDPDIEVKAHREGDQVVISVRDHGLGIDGEDLGRIGERFFRAKTSTGIAGTGIGFNLAQTLVEMHGGSVNVNSKKGEGSIFTVRLPIAGPDQSELADNRVA